MLIKRFQEQVETSPQQIAIKADNRTITYKELNEVANQVAASIIKDHPAPQNTQEPPLAALLFEHGTDMIFSVIGALKAHRIYVPLDTSYPINRLAYMLKDSGAKLILTNSKNITRAFELVDASEQDIAVLNIDQIDDSLPVDNIDASHNIDTSTQDNIAYILYTSGSTARPKGVYQTHRNVLYYTLNWIDRFNITSADRMSLFTAFSHDGAVQDMFSALLSGATLLPYSIKSSSGADEISALLETEEITIWHSVPSLFRFFTGDLTDKTIFPNIRWVLLGGEPLRAHDLKLFHASYPNATLANVYGQTESSVGAICKMSHQDTFDNITLGEPLDETELLLVTEEGVLVEEMGVGEVVINCDHIAPGYWHNDEATAKVFKEDEELGRLYFTGDMGRMGADESIKLFGRKDHQVKVRGYRIELGEIETVLLRHQAVKETVCIAMATDNEDNYLCAYYVSERNVTIDQLRDHLADELPDYMIPRYFIRMEVMPLTPNGKIDRKALPQPGEDVSEEVGYVAPTNETEEKLAAIWKEVLEVEKVGIHDNFIELGGHSLLVISIISRVHQEFNIELQMTDVFDHPTINELAMIIGGSDNNTMVPVTQAPESEFYPATSDQYRLFVLNQLEDIGVTYNLTGISLLEGHLDWERFRKALKTLVARHEALRTSFHMEGDRLVQVVHNDIDFNVPYIKRDKELSLSDVDIESFIQSFSKPFDLGKAPLVRCQLEQLGIDKHLFLMDVHHIVSDGVSESILMEEFSRLYHGQNLEPITLQYKDYAYWLNSQLESEKENHMEKYWLDVFKDKIPVLELPYNFPRPKTQSFQGDIVGFLIDPETTQRINHEVKKRGITLYMFMLAVYNVLLHKYSGQSDIVVGSIIAGRNQVELEKIVGFFVKTLALRNQPQPQKTFNQFLSEIRDHVLKAYENQAYPFDRLVEKIGIKKDPARNPLFDTCFILQNAATVISNKPRDNMGLTIRPYLKKENRNVMFDLQLELYESEKSISGCIHYCSKLFTNDAIQLMTKRFVTLIEQVLEDMDVKIEDLDYSTAIEKELNQIQEVEFEF